MKLLRLLRGFLGVFWRLLSRTLDIWLKANAFIFSAALAFFTVFSVAPVMILAVTVVGVVFGEKAASGAISAHLQDTFGPQVASTVERIIVASQPSQSGLWPTLIGAVAMLFGATTVFVQLQLALNTIWSVIPKPSRSSVWLFIKSRLLSLSMILVIGLLLLASMLQSVVLQRILLYASELIPIHPTIVAGLEWGVSFMIMVGLFAAIFKILPDVSIRWRDVLSGATVTALLFLLGRGLIAHYLATTATTSAYGAAGSLALLLLWINYSSLILLFGAALTRAFLEIRNLPVTPRNSAVRIHLKIEEEPENRENAEQVASASPQAATV